MTLMAIGEMIKPVSIWTMTQTFGDSTQHLEAIILMKSSGERYLKNWTGFLATRNYLTI